MSTKHTLGTDLEKYMSNEDNANDISRAVIYDSSQDQRLLRKVDLRWHFKSKSTHLTVVQCQLTLTAQVVTYTYLALLAQFLGSVCISLFLHIRIHLLILAPAQT